MSESSDTRWDRSLTECARTIRIGVVCSLALGIAGCSEASGDSSSDKVEGASSSRPAAFSASLEEEQCAAVPKDLVAETFAVPAEEIEVTNTASFCEYAWEGEAEILEVNVSVEVFETADKASDRFRSTTAGVSADEVAGAMAEAAAQAQDEVNSGAANAVDKLGKGFSAGGLQFEDVAGVGDEARFGTRFGKLYLRQGNLQLSLSAYRGPGMTMPEKLTPESIMNVHQEWQRETLAARKKQSIELAKAAIEHLQDE